MHTIDFGRSYLRWRLDRQAMPPVTVSHPMPHSVNNVRISLECRCELVERSSGHARVYVLGASCKSERVGVDRDIWLDPNSDYALVMSADEYLILKSWAHTGIQIMRYPESLGPQPQRQSGDNREAWVEYAIDIRSASGRQLDTIDDIIAAIRGNRPLVSHTEYDDGDYRVVIDHPVKTINYSEREKVFQTDTGPILLPDLSAARLRQGGRLVECFDLAYSAFNAADWVEFVVNVPTDVGQGLAVNHYSQSRRIEAVTNRLIEVVDDA